MTESAALGAAVGILLGLHQFKVWTLLPAILLVVSGAILYGLVCGLNLLTITLYSLCAVVSLEIGYFLFAIVGKYLQIKARDKNAELFRAVRAAIGRELETHFQLPEDMPPEMAAMLTKLR